MMLIRFPSVLGLAVVAGLIAVAPSSLHAQASGDDLDWIGGTANTSWTAPGNLWDDITQLGTGGGTPVSLSAASGNQGLTYGLFFIGGGNPTFGTVAPTTLDVTTNADRSGQLLGVDYLSFTSDFNPTTTMTLASGRTDGLATSLNFVSGWTINDRATSGTVTFNTSSTNNYGLYFTLNGAGSISNAAGSSVVINLALTDGTSAGSITKTDAGKLTINATGSVIGGNNYSGGTTVNGGTLVTVGSYATGTGAVTVSNAGSTLAGSGIIAGAVTVNSGAILSPGVSANSIASLQLGGSGVTSGLTLNGVLAIDILGGGTTAGVNNDELSVKGIVTLNATSSQLVLNAINPAGLAIGQKFYLVLNDGTDPVIGTFEGLLQGATVTDSAGDTYTINYLDNGDGGGIGTVGNDISLTVTSVVPEPSACVLLSAGLAGLALTVRRRRAGQRC